MSDKHYRSIAKGISWRIVGTLDTIFLSWLVIGRMGIALKIGAIEVFTKVFLYYIHERLWLSSDFARETIRLGDGTIMRKDRHYRSLLKGISWRIFGTLDTITIALFVTGDYRKAFGIGFTEVITKVFLYYLHERVWHRIKFGRDPCSLE